MVLFGRDGPSDYVSALVREIAQLMEGRAYRRYMVPCLSVRERAHLWALRSQALFGDAPMNCELRESNGNEKDTESKSKQTTATDASAAGKEKMPQKPDHWYQFTQRLYYSAWVALRGSMSPQLAGEALCTEFLYLLKIHDIPCMIPLMEAALSTARARAVAFNSNSREKISGSGRIRNKLPTSLCEGFYVRGFYGDPVVIAFLWLCRAHSIPCIVNFEPLSCRLPQVEEDLFLVKSLTQNTVVTEPLAAFVLSVELYMPQCEHWLGMLPAGQYSASSSLHTARALKKSAWIEYMHHIMTDLRAPLLRFLREVARGKGKKTYEKAHESKMSNDVSSELLKRRHEMCKSAIKSLEHYEGYAHHYYKLYPLTVLSVAELCVAAYSFIFCSSPLCSEMRPPKEAMASVFGKRGVHETLASDYGNASVYRDSKSSEDVETSLQGTTALISGVPKQYQEIATRILDSAGSLHSPSSVTIKIDENSGGRGSYNKGKKNKSFLGGSGFLQFDSAWNGVVPGVNEAAMILMDKWIRITFSPLRRSVAELLSCIWCTTNEQCIGFPFLVVDKEQQNFITTPTNTVSSSSAFVTRNEAPWRERSAAEVARTYWEKLLAAFDRSPSSSERRTYQNTPAKL